MDSFRASHNGPGFANNRYNEKLAAAHSSLSFKGLPDLEARAVQLLLTYHGFNPRRAVITAFRTKHRRPVTEDHKDLRAALLELLTPAESDQSAPLSPTRGAAPDLRLVQSLLE